MELNQLFSRCADVCAHPARAMQAAKEAGKRLIGCPPVYVPEELIYACGALPVGLWGADIGISRAKEYFPAFICSIMQSILELGIRGFWNFSHYDLSVPYPDAVVENVHLGDSLMSLGYRLRND